MIMATNHEGEASSDTSHNMSTDSVPRAPPPEKPAAIHTRLKVIAAFWAVVIFLGFPIWWQTTSIYRAHLPLHEMVDWANGKVDDTPDGQGLD